MGFHPIRKVKRTLRTTKRKAAAVAVVALGAGGGTGVAAPDSVPGQLTNDFVRVVNHATNKIVGSNE